MRVVALADLHLGFRQYQRTTSTGVNQREADVARTFTAVVDRVIGLAPDLIVIAGDVFHAVRPTNNTILHAFTEFSRLAQSLPNTPIVLVAGNHDTPLSTETGGILQLFAPLGIHVVDRAARRLTFPELELSVLAVPDARCERPALEPDPTARFNVLLLHGEVRGMLPAGVAAARAAVEISHDELHTPEWDYIALGHWHVYREIAPNCFYSGSIDYTSTNPWGELAEESKAGLIGKGFAERDLVTGEQIFHPLPTSRPLLDIPAIDCAGLSAIEIDAKLRYAVDCSDGGIDEKVVRLVLRNVDRDIAKDLDHRAIREYKRRALNLNLDIRRPDTAIMQSGIVRRRGQPINELIRDILTNRYELAPDVNKAEFLAGAERYLEEAAALRGASAEAIEPVAAIAPIEQMEMAS